MISDPFLRSLTSRACGKSNRRPKRSIVPALTALEDRRVLSTLTVTSAADDGSIGTLRAEIGAASAGDTISFANQLKGSTITLKQGELSITKSLNIEGPGAAKLTISGDDASRVMAVAPGVSLTLAGLTIAHGRYDTTLGGGTLTFGGGGILNEPGASLTLVDDTLSDNQAVGHQALGVNGQDELGGAIFNLGKAIVSGCTFMNNQVTGGGDASSNIGGSAGGAIDNYDGASLTVANSVFRSNRVLSADGAGYFALGGAIESNAGTGEHGDNNPSTAVLTNCMFVGNLAQGGASAVSNGGALMSEGTGTTMILTDCQVFGNRSLGGQGARGIGGGIMNIGLMTISGCAIEGNQVVGGSNAATPSTGAGFGGGVSNDGGVLNVANSVISGNCAKGGSNTTGPGSDAWGGGINNSASSTMTVTASVVEDNSAIASSGGGNSTGGVTSGFAQGGGIDTASSTTTLVGCTVAFNVAQGSAGQSGNTGGDGLGGGLGAGRNALLGGVDHSQLMVVACTVVDNRALGGAGAAGASGGQGLGGGLVVDPGSSASLTASIIAKNSAVGGAGGEGASDGNGLGGGAYVFDLGTLTYDSTTQIKNNRASTSNDNIYP
jgi:hypothetical protein